MPIFPRWLHRLAKKIRALIGLPGTGSGKNHSQVGKGQLAPDRQVGGESELIMGRVQIKGGGAREMAAAVIGFE